MDYVELFCGCGGMAEGLRQAGWACHQAVDNDPFAMALYGANFPEHPQRIHDLNEPMPDAAALRKCVRAGVLVGGSPCQDFALTCTPEKRERGERAQLTRAFARHVADLQPEWVVFENVKYSARRAQFLAFLDDLRELGYAFEHRILNTRDLGMTQPRCRLILIAHRDRAKVDAVWAEVVRRLEPRPTPMTLRQTFAAFGVPAPRDHAYYPIPRADKIQPSVFSLDDRGERRAIFTVRGRTRRMPPSYVFRAKDSTQSRDEVFDIRTEHIAALQGFPKHFQMQGTTGRLDQAIGNAVPPPLAALIGCALAAVARAT